MTDIVYHPRADDEVFESARLYERSREGLGWRFLRAVQRAEGRISDGPLVFPILRDGIRKCPVRRFPFNVLFRVDGDWYEDKDRIDRASGSRTKAFQPTAHKDAPRLKAGVFGWQVERSTSSTPTY